MPADADACVPREIATASWCSSNEEASAAFGNRYCFSRLYQAPTSTSTRDMTDENSFVMVNFSVWQNVSLERAKSTVPNVAHATLCQQELNGARYKQTAGCRQFVSLFPPLRERADARIRQIPDVHARQHPCG